MSKAIWQGCDLLVTAKLIPKFLWTTASIDVFLNGECILSTGGQLKFIGSVRSEFRHNGSLHQADLSWGLNGPLRFPYRLKIDDEIVNESRVLIGNWPVGIMFWILLISLIVKIVHF